MVKKKCIVVDLDNTLWGGVVGEDGLSGIKLSLDKSGAGYIAFQQALKDLYDRGVILAVNSRNNYDDAMAVIETHPNMILKPHHFAAVRINWQDKARNLIELAKEINVGLDSIVFLDDDPVNRALIKATIKEVEVPELPADPLDYAKFLINLPFFPSSAITDEDKMRGSFYVTERLRKEAEKAYGSREEFLKNLGLELKIYIDEPKDTARLAQLTEKTNQLNVNKIPLSEERILEFVNHPDYKVFHGSLTDRFGDHGIIIFAVIANNNCQWQIEHFLMSCRVIGRGVEDAFLSAIGQVAFDNQVKELSINFIKTEKNKPAEEFTAKHFAEGSALVKKIIHQPAWVNIKYGKI